MLCRHVLVGPLSLCSFFSWLLLQWHTAAQEVPGESPGSLLSQCAYFNFITYAWTLPYPPSLLLYGQTLRLEYGLVDVNRVCPGICNLFHSELALLHKSMLYMLNIAIKKISYTGVAIPCSASDTLPAYSSVFLPSFQPHSLVKTYHVY